QATPCSSPPVPGISSRTTGRASSGSSAAARRRTRTTTPSSSSVRTMAERSSKMISLGFGKWARADRIYALEPLEGQERGHGRRTRVWVDGVPEAIVASRTERTILAEMGADGTSSVLDDALHLAERLAAPPAGGARRRRGVRGRRARRVLEKTARPSETEQLF